MAPNFRFAMETMKSARLMLRHEKEFLFIGGPVDGQRIAVYETEQTVGIVDDAKMVQNYHRYTIVFPEGQIEVFLFERLDSADLCELLLKNYKSQDLNQKGKIE